MNNNYLQPPNNQNNAQEPPKRRTGLLSGGYAEQAAPQVPQQIPQFNQQGPQGQWNGPAFMARPVQMVQRWSNKMYAMRRPAPNVDPNPLVRYHAPQAVQRRGERVEKPVPTRPEPWRRSRTTKITYLIRKRRERSYRNGPNRKRVGTIVGSVLIALLAIILASGGISSYVFYQSQLPKVNGLANFQVAQSSRIYDRNGVLLTTKYNDKYGRSTPISYSQVPGFMQDAQIAAEDKSFWSNNGVDLAATLRSALIDTGAGSAQTGASTLTQQLVKNITDNKDPSVQRKLSEAALAIGLTNQYPKWKIMEMYLNIAPYGTQEQGIEAAAQDFFGLQPQCGTDFKNCTPAISFLDRDLSKCKVTKPQIDETTCVVDPILGLARASLMAAIPQNPPSYDPIANPGNLDGLLKRQNYVLIQMLNAGMSINIGLGSKIQNSNLITPQVIQQVEAVTKKIDFTGFHNSNKAPHFVNWVIQTLADSLGSGDNEEARYTNGLTVLDNSGLNIYTTLDFNLETYVENAVKRHLDQPEVQEYREYQGAVVLSQNNNIHDSAVVVMDAKTGEVLAMNGSADWNDSSKQGSGNTNMATSPRQPASTFKTIAVAAAYQAGWYPGMIAADFKTYFPVGTDQSQATNASNTYVPPDYGGTWHNMNTNVSVAISNSFNIPALKAEYYAGVQNVYNMALRLGITTINPKTDVVPSMTLGTSGVSLLQMTGAYQTFANQGTRIPPHNILDIWDNYGHNLYHYDPSHPNGSQVVSPQVAYLVTSTIDSPAARYVEFQGDTLLNMYDWTLPDGTHPDVAAKTGTSDNFDDNWTIGYTPDVVVGVWSGNADDSGMINSIGLTGASPIWHSVMEYVSGKCNTASDSIPCPKLDFNYGDRHFTVPDGPDPVVQQSVNTVNGLQGSGYSSYMLASEVPQQSGIITTCPANGGPGNCNGTGNPTP